MHSTNNGGLLPSERYAHFPRWIQRTIDSFRNEEVRKLRSPIIAGVTAAVPISPRCTCGNHLKVSFDTTELSGKQVVFVYDPLVGATGSTILRVFQSSATFASAFPDIVVSVCSVQAKDLLKLRKAILVFVKHPQISIKRLRELVARENTLVIDYVDGRHRPEIDRELHGFVCSSFTEFAWMKNRIRSDQRVALVPHAANLCFSELSRAYAWTEFGVGYYGAPENGLFAAELEALGLLDFGRLSLSPVDGNLTHEWIAKVSAVPFQYIARPQEQISDGRFKPFNKGFQSAQIGQLVVGARFDAENRYWLGDDYPFYVEEESQESAEAAVRQCREAWESGNLTFARETMLRLRRVSCPVQNVIDYLNAFVQTSR